jgi:hypothetical protein
MRLLAAGERSMLGGARLAVKGRAEILDTDGVWRNASSLGGPGEIYDFFDSAEWGAGPDDSVVAATITLKRKAGSVSIAPLMGGSPVNRNAANAYVPLIKENRKIRFYTATGLPGFTPGSSALNAWHRVFEGKIDTVNSANGPNITLYCRDIGAYLQIPFIKSRTITYGSASPGTAMETVMQQVINDWMPNPVPLTYPVASGANVSTFKPGIISVMSCLQMLASRIGWVVRYEWATDGSDNYELRFFKPGTKGADDTTFTNAEYLTLDELETSDADIINSVRVDGYSAAGSEITASATDAASIAEYGERWGNFQEGEGSFLDTVPELQRLADAAVGDLATPYASHKIETLYAWYVERGDRHGYAGNGEHYDSTQTLYVVDFRHRLYNGTGRTTIMARGKPVARYRDWFSRLNSPEEALPLALLSVLATEFPSSYTIEWDGTGLIELSIDGGAWAAPPASPITVARNAENGAAKLYRFRASLGLDVAEETIYVLPIGAISPPPNLTVTPSLPQTATQSFTVTATNPRTGGPAPTLKVSAVGAGGLVTKPDTSTVAIVDGASPITIPTGSVVAMTRPAFGAGSGSVIFEADLPGGSIAIIQRTVTPRQSIGPNLNVVATPFVSTYSVTWTGDGVQLAIDGGAFAVPPASPIVVTRPAIGQPDKVYTFRGTLDGQTVTNSITIPAIGSPETPNLTVQATGQSDTQLTFTVTATSPGGGSSPGIVGYLTDATFASGHTNGGSIVSGATVIINRPAFGNKRDGIFRVRAAIGASYEEVVHNIPPQVQLSFGPTLSVIPTAFANSYSIAFAGDLVQVDKRDGNGYVSPGTSPMTVTRPAAGSADVVYTFRAVKDGQEVTNSITIPAVGRPETPNLNVVPAAPTSTQQSFTVTASPAGTTIAVYLAGSGVSFASAHYSGGPVASGDVVTVNKAPFGNEAGSVRFVATLGSSSEEVSRTIVTQIKTTFGPTLDVAIVEYSDRVAITWNGAGSTVQAAIDNGARYSPSNPEIVYRSGAGGQPKQVIFTAEKDGQTISNTITVAAVQRLGPTFDFAITEYAGSVSIAWNSPGGVVEAAIDNGSHYTPSNPEVVNRNGLGGQPKQITFFATKDGQMIANTITVAATQPPAIKSASSSAHYDTPFAGAQEVDASWTRTPAVDDSVHSVSVDFFKNGQYFASVNNVTPSTEYASTYVTGQATPGSARFHAVVTLTGGGITSTVTTRAGISTI